MICKHCHFEGKAMKAAPRRMRQCSACHKWSRVVTPVTFTLKHARTRLLAACALLEGTLTDPPPASLAEDIELFLITVKKEMN